MIRLHRWITIASLMGSLGEVERIEAKDDGFYIQIRFLICDDDVAMKEVTKKRFMEFHNSMENVCKNSCNKKLYEEWKKVGELL